MINMEKNNVFDTNCPMARVTEFLGDGWTLLLLREAFIGTRRFNDFERELGIARNILSVRLKKLVEAGIFERTPSSEDGRVVEYRLSEAGLALLPVLISLSQWSTQWLCSGEDVVRFIDSDSGEEIPTMQVIDSQGRPLERHRIRMVAGKRADETIKARYARAASG